MNIVFSHLDEVTLHNGQVYSMMMQSTASLYRVRKLLREWIYALPMTSPYLYVRESNKDVVAKQLYVIHLQQAVFELEEDKEFSKWIVQHLKYLLEHDEYFIKQYNHVMSALEQLVLNSSLHLENIQIDFDLTDKVIEGLLKHLSIQITSNTHMSIHSIELRKIYIEVLLKLNVQKKPVFILYEFPENDAANNEYFTLIEYLKSLEVTVLCLSNSKDFVKQTDIENVLLMYDNGSKYSVMDLKKELHLFNYEHHKLSDDELTKTLALVDFYQEYDLLDKKYIDFLESRTFPM